MSERTRTRKNNSSKKKKKKKNITHPRLLELRVGVLVRLDVLALALLVVVVLVLLRAHLAPGKVVDKVHARVVRRQRAQLEQVAPVAVQAVLAVDELGVGHVDGGVALEEVGDGVLVAEARVVGVLLWSNLEKKLKRLTKKKGKRFFSFFFFFFFFFSFSPPKFFKKKKTQSHRRGQLLHQHVLEPGLGDPTQLRHLLEKVLGPVRVADQHHARVDPAAAVAEREARLVAPDDEVLALEALEGEQEGDVDDHGVRVDPHVPEEVSWRGGRVERVLRRRRVSIFVNFWKEKNMKIFQREKNPKKKTQHKTKKTKNSPVGVGVVLEALEDPADLVPHVVQGRVREARGDDDGVVVEPVFGFWCFLKRK